MVLQAFSWWISQWVRGTQTNGSATATVAWDHSWADACGRGQELEGLSWSLSHLQWLAHKVPHGLLLKWKSATWSNNQEGKGRCHLPMESEPEWFRYFTSRMFHWPKHSSRASQSQSREKQTPPLNSCCNDSVSIDNVLRREELGSRMKTLHGTLKSLLECLGPSLSSAPDPSFLLMCITASSS